MGWHSGGGGGIWLNFFESRNALSLGVAASKEATLVQAEVAFGF